MDLEKELLKKQSLTQCNRIIKWIADDETRFRRLTELFFKGDYRLTQHAAWPMSYCIRKHPGLAKHYYKNLLTSYLPLILIRQQKEISDGFCNSLKSRKDSTGS